MYIAFVFSSFFPFQESVECALQYLSWIQKFLRLEFTMDILSNIYSLLNCLSIFFFFNICFCDVIISNCEIYSDNMSEIVDSGESIHDYICFLCQGFGSFFSLTELC